jgi:hypothetical protein
MATICQTSFKRPDARRSFMNRRALKPSFATSATRIRTRVVFSLFTGRNSCNVDERRAYAARFKRFSYEELNKRDKANLDIFWLKDESLEDSANLPAPGVLALEITEDLEAALEQFAAIAEDLAAEPVVG